MLEACLGVNLLVVASLVLRLEGSDTLNPKPETSFRPLLPYSKQSQSQIRHGYFRDLLSEAAALSDTAISFVWLIARMLPAIRPNVCRTLVR